MKKSILIRPAAVILLVMILFCTCSCNTKTLTDEPNSDDSMTDFAYEYVEPLSEDIVTNSQQFMLTTNQVFSASGYFVRGIVTSLKELKMSHKQYGMTQTEYGTIAEMDVIENYSSNSLTFEHDNTITFVYTVCSRNFSKDHVKLQVGTEYILLLNDTVKCSPRVGLEEYGRYTSLYSQYSVIEKTDNGYNANAFMVNILGMEEKDTWTLKEIKKAVKPYADKMTGMTIQDALNQK